MPQKKERWVPLGAPVDVIPKLALAAPGSSGGGIIAMAIVAATNALDGHASGWRAAGRADRRAAGCGMEVRRSVMVCT